MSSSHIDVPALAEEIKLFLQLRQTLDNAVNAPEGWRRDQARGIMHHALDIARDMCGSEVLRLAFGDAADEAERSDQLLKLADRLHWPAYLFAGVAPSERRGSFEALAEECESVARGDAPKLLAKVPGYRRNIRLLVAKFSASRWDAYLDGLGVPASTRHSALSMAFGQEWDTMSRWHRDAAATWGNEPIKSRLALERRAGEQDQRNFSSNGLEICLPAIGRSGRTFRRVLGHT